MVRVANPRNRSIFRTRIPLSAILNTCYKTAVLAAPTCKHAVFCRCHSGADRVWSGLLRMDSPMNRVPAYGGSLILFCGLLCGCGGGSSLYRPAPLIGEPPYVIIPPGSPGPIHSPPPTVLPPPVASPQPSDLPLDGGGISLQPAMRTSAWYMPGYQPWRTPTMFAPMTPATFISAPGPRYADLGRPIDGRPFGQYAISSGGSRADGNQRRKAGQIGQAPRSAQLVDGLPATPSEDLKFRGGKTIRDLTYINIYVGGKQAWSDSDRKNIDWSLVGAMTDPHLNHVIMQYFNDQPISASHKGSYILDGFRPQRVTQANIREVVRLLHSRGSFSQLPFGSTVINFMLPRGMVLADPYEGSQQASLVTNGVIPHAAEPSSLEGLGGYHGSVHIGSETLYYAIGVYSERTANGQSNGIPVFAEPWKNIVATFYHQLQETRTDPDVDDAITTGQERYVGWASDTGLEIADFPVHEDGNNGKLDQVFREITLANGSGTVPVQFLYSNAVHGPEGPITVPHRGSPLPIPPVPGSTPGSSPNTTPPPGPSNGGLDIIKQEWDQLPEAIKQQILRLVEDAAQH